jgi:glycerophosphoryl diester phosphodiesterase
MPTLREVIRYVNGKTNRKVGFQIEFKTDPEHNDWTFTPAEFAAALYEILVEEDIVGLCEIQSFDWRCLYELQKLNQKIKTAYLTEWDNEPGTPYSFFDPDPAIAGLWTGGVLVKDHKNSIPQMVKDLGGTCWEPEDVELTKAKLDEAHALGLKVVVWTWPEHSKTTFNVGLVSELIDWGVDGIITDDPGMLISMLAARNYQLPARY